MAAKAQSNITPLMLASLKGNIELVSLLIKHGADKNARSDNGETALSIAMQNRHLEIVNLLEKTGAKEESQDYSVLKDIHDEIYDFSIS